MTSLRLALKQSLEETSSPAPPSAQAAPPAPGRMSPQGQTPTASSVASHFSGGSPSTEEGDGQSPMPKKRGPGRPRKYPRTGDPQQHQAQQQQPRKRGRPRKHPLTDEDAYGSENEFSVEMEEKVPHPMAAAASTIQSHWKKAKGKPSTEGVPVEAAKRKERRPDEPNPSSLSSTSNPSKPVTPPTLQVIEWMRSMPVKRARKAVVPGLRVKVRFVTNSKIKKDGKVVRKRIWYGGRITLVSKEGSKIKIKYDDKTSEVTQFPDKDVVIDDYLNGKHHARADKFIPPEEEDDDDDDDEENVFGEEMEQPISAARLGERPGEGHMKPVSEKREMSSSSETPKMLEKKPQAKEESLPESKPGFILPKTVPVEAPVSSPSQKTDANDVPSSEKDSRPEYLHAEPEAEKAKEPPAAAPTESQVAFPKKEIKPTVTNSEHEPVPTAGDPTEESMDIEAVPASSPKDATVVESQPVAADQSEPEPEESMLIIATEEQPMEVEKSGNTSPEAMDIDDAAEETVAELPETEVTPKDPPVPHTTVDDEEPSAEHDDVVKEASVSKSPDASEGELPTAKVGTEEAEAVSLPSATVDTSDAPAQVEAVVTAEETKEDPTEPEGVEAALSAVVADSTEKPEKEASREIEDLAPPASGSVSEEKDVTPSNDSTPEDEAKSSEGMVVASETSQSPVEEPVKPKRKRGRPPKIRPPADTPVKSASESDNGAAVVSGKPSLTIRIPNLKDSSGAGDADAARGKKRPIDDVEDAPATKRLHIHIGSKEGTPKDLSELRDEDDEFVPLKDPAVSPRPKKVKRKRERDLDSPEVDSKAEGNFSGDRSERETEEEGDEKFGTPGGQTKIDLLAVARSERKAAQEANERISSKNEVPADQMGKKKKKKRKEMEGDTGHEDIPEFQWVQCDKCSKWRVIPSSVVDSLPPKWYCANNEWDKKRASCDAPEQTPKQVQKERKRKKRKLMMEREAAEAAERTAAGLAAETSSNMQNSDDAKTSNRASPSETSFDSGRGGDAAKAEKKSVASNKKTKTAATSEVPSIPEEEPKPRGRGRPRRNPPKETATASAPTTPRPNAPSTTDEADNVEWVQCEKCDKWRKLPPHISADELPDVWYCSMNTWNPGAASCSAPEDKAEGLQDIFNNNISGKLSYRNLIFGSNGRKHNRPVSERTRAAESLFAAVSDDSDAPPTVMYANSSAFVSRSRNQQSDENQPRLLDLMARSQFWTELQKSQAYAGPLVFDDLPAESREALKDIVLHCLGDSTLTGEEVHKQVRAKDWESAPAGWTAVRKYCTENILVMAMCELVRMGVLECFRVDGPFPNGLLWTLCYRRAKARISPPLAASPAVELPSTGSRCMKIAKPWKRASIS